MARRPPPRLTALLLLALSSGATGGVAQSRPEPFQTVDLRLAVLADVSNGALHRYWSPGAAYGAGVALPFYAGTVETGAQYARPSPRRDGVPRFRSLFLYAGWGAEQKLSGRWQAGGGVRVGVLAMRFDGDTISVPSRRESEMGLALRAALRWMPFDRWFTEAAVTYQSILTRPRTEQVFLSLGIARRFDTPTWLRDFLD
ncbi:MAG TPA: hypothetical protein VFZ26_08230 [Gemmatimonadales bacterium]